jgi:hypothetical protein
VWDQGITDLAAINFQLSLQCVPIFLFGLFANRKTDLHPWCLTIGAICSTMYVFVLYFGYIKPTEDSISVNAGITGLGLQLVISISLEALRRLVLSGKEFEDDKGDLMFPYRPNWDIPARQRFGTCALTPDLLWKMMDGMYEPLTNPWFCWTMFLGISFMTPIVDEGSPSLMEEMAVVNGLPWWVFKMLLIGIIPSGLLFVAFSQIPNQFPEHDPEKTMDPNVMELTREELGHRVKYDSRNVLADRRRKELRAITSTAGTHSSDSSA